MKATPLNDVKGTPIFWMMFLAEGFLESEKNDFYNHCLYLTRQLFRISPFSVVQKRIAAYAYFKISNTSSFSGSAEDTAYNFFENDDKLITYHPGIIVDDINQIKIRYDAQSIGAKNIWFKGDQNDSLVIVICNSRKPIKSLTESLSKLDDNVYPSNNFDAHKDKLRDLSKLRNYIVLSTFPFYYPLTSTDGIKNQKIEAGAIFAKMIGYALGLDSEGNDLPQKHELDFLGEIPFDATFEAELNSNLSIDVSSPDNVINRNFREQLNINLDDTSEVTLEGVSIDFSDILYVALVVEDGKKWILRKEDLDSAVYIIIKESEYFKVWEDKNNYPNSQSYWTLFHNSAFDLSNLKWRNLISNKRKSKKELVTINDNTNFKELNTKIKNKILVVDNEIDQRFFKPSGREKVDLSKLNIIKDDEFNYKGAFECIMNHETFKYTLEGSNQLKVKRMSFCKICETDIKSHFNINSITKNLVVFKESSPRTEYGDFPKIESRIADSFYKYVKADKTNYFADRGFNCVQTTIYRFMKFLEEKTKLRVKNFETHKLPTKPKKGERWPYLDIKFPKLHPSIRTKKAFVLWVSNQGGMKETRDNFITGSAGLGAAGALHYLGLGRVKNELYAFEEINSNLAFNQNTVVGYSREFVVQNPDKFQVGSLMQVWLRYSGTDITENGKIYSKEYLDVYSYCNGFGSLDERSGHSLVYLGVENNKVRVADQYGNKLYLEEGWRASYNFLIFGEWYDAIF